MFRNVSARVPIHGFGSCVELLDFHALLVVTTTGNVAGPSSRPPRKDCTMRRDVRSSRRLAGIAAVAGLAAGLAALFASASAPAAPTRGAALTAGHKCLVMTGSGDPAFVKNFNPYTATGAPTGA